MPTFHEDWYYDTLLGELAKLLSSIREVDGLIVDIGCWEGKSTIAILNAAHPETVICVDHWKGNLGESEATGQEHRSVELARSRNVYKTFVENVLSSTNRNFLIEKMDYVRWIPKVDRPIKFCHIDISNDYKSVKDAILSIQPKMAPGGLLCGYNYLSADVNEEHLQGGVMRAVRELCPGHRHVEELWIWRKPTE